MRKDINTCTFFGTVHQSAQSVSIGPHAPVEFIIKTSHQYRVGSAWKTQSDFIRCLWWGPEARAEAHTVHKSARVFVQGRLETIPGLEGIRVASVTVVAAQHDKESQEAEDD